MNASMGLRSLPLIALCFLAASCRIDWSDPEWDGETGGEGIEVSTELFAENGTAGEWLFFTNDAERALPHGKSFWYPTGDYQATFGSWSVIATKEGGEAYAGYGMIFCHGSDGSEESMLTAMIRCDGYFQVAEVVGADYRPFDDWIADDAIVEGYGRENEIRVVRSAGGTFTLMINDIEVYQFTDDEEPFHAGGGQGFLAVVSPLEDFPDFPVSVRYRLP